ncbi:MAG: transglycosylase domain-containing protein [Bacilli bacterium]|nr:transglycosylase domain-containing protein [Bacilli bacterium]
MATKKKKTTKKSTFNKPSTSTKTKSSVLEELKETKKTDKKETEVKKKTTSTKKTSTKTKVKETIKETKKLGETKKTTAKKKTTNKRKTTKKKDGIAKKYPLIVLEGNQLKKPIKTKVKPKKKDKKKVKAKKCKVSTPLFKKNPKKEYNKLERRKEIYEDEHSKLVFHKYKENPIYLWPIVFLKNRFKVMIFDMKRFRKRLKYGTFKDKLLILFMLLLIFICLAGVGFMGYIVIHAPQISKEKLYQASSTVLYDANGNEFARLGSQNREVVTYDELPEVLIDAIVATEDSRFFQHNGIDLARFTKAVGGQLLGHSDAGGGSTLTMQISKLVATSTKSTGIQGIIRKFTDIYLAVFVIEKKYTKEEILEFYTNIPYLGAAYGVEQASNAYFGKSAKDLTLPEAALIAGLYQAPDSYNPYNNAEKANQRKNIVLNLMKRHGYISEEECEAAKKIHIKDLLKDKTGSSVNRYVSFVDTVVDEVIKRTGNNPYNVSMSIYTTLVPEKQDVVNDITNGDFAKYGQNFKYKNDYSQVGIAVTSVKDGSIIAIGGGRNKKGERSFNYATQISRHPGSTAKPVIDYGPAIEYLGWGSSNTVVDLEYNYSSGGSIKNWDNKFKGVMTIKYALAQSRNIPALQTFQQTTNAQKKEFANNLGWYPIEDGNGNLLETNSIGGFDGVNPLQSSAAYGAFARGGTYIEPYSFKTIEYTDTGETYKVNPKRTEVMSEDTAYIITQILKYAVQSGAVSSGTVSGTDICAKTGTSTVDAAIKRDLGIHGDLIGDSWENVYSPDYVISTWYGYDKITKDHYLLNSEGGAARKAITKSLVKGIMEKNSTFTKPSTVEEVTVELETDPIQLASEYTPSDLKEVAYFKDGTAPDTVSERFSQLPNVGGLKATKNGSQVTLTWNGYTPNAISDEWLTKYFNESKIYKPWAERMKNERVAYNNSVFGTFGYRVYQQTASGTVDLGFTTNTTMAVNLPAGEVTYIVKASYSNFTANMSAGTTAKVEGIATNYEISYKGSNCTNYSSYSSTGGSSVESKVDVKLNGSVITPSSHGLSVQATCYDSSNNQTQCQRLSDGNTYSVKFDLIDSSKKSLKSTTIRVSNNC